MSGAIKVLVNLDIVKNVLLKEGFYDPGILQTWKKGQVFGLVKPLNKLIEVHVRGYKDGILDAEVELSREYLEHPYEVKPFYGFLIRILRKYRIPFKVIRPIPPDPKFIRIPKTLTRWKPLVVGGLILTVTFTAIKLLSKRKY